MPVVYGEAEAPPEELPPLPLSLKPETPVDDPDYIPPENERAQTAYYDYLAMGPGRSLDKLKHMYLAQRDSGVHPTTTNHNTLHAWSARYRWQERVAKYEQERRAELLARAAAAREDSLRLVRKAKAKLEAAIDAGDYKQPNLGPDLRHLVGLEMQLLDDPLATRTEVANPDGETFAVTSYEHLDNAQLAELAQQVAASAGVGSEVEEE